MAAIVFEVKKEYALNLDGKTIMIVDDDKW